MADSERRGVTFRVGCKVCFRVSLLNESGSGMVSKEGMLSMKVGWILSEGMESKVILRVSTMRIGSVSVSVEVGSVIILSFSK